MQIKQNMVFTGPIHSNVLGSLTKKIFIGLCLCLNLGYAATLSRESLTIGDHQLNYYKIGQGKPIVMLMGYGLTNGFWSKPFIDCLSQEHTLYILDYINVARPEMDLMADEVNNFINQANLDHPEVIGWSMGGGIALSLAYKYPHSVAKLGLISSVVAEPSISQIVAPYVAKNNSLDEKLGYVFGNNIYEYKSKDLFKYKKQMLSNGVFVNNDVLNLQKTALANWMINPDNSTMLTHLKVPANVIIAKYDAILNPQVELHIFNQYPKVNITIINGGHASFYQAPQQVCRAVLN